AADGDLDGLDPRRRVGVRAAKADGGAPGVPRGVRVVAAGGREGEERARVGGVVGERAARWGLAVTRVVGRLDADRVAAVGREVGRREGVGPVTAGTACRVPNLAAAREAGAVPVVAHS